MALVVKDVESAIDAEVNGNFCGQEVIMLVLSRNEGDGIAFPELDLAIQVLKINGNRVQLGVKAAEVIRVLRSELLERADRQTMPVESEAQHSLRNRINAVVLAMTISQKHLERGDMQKAEMALQQIATKLQPKTTNNGLSKKLKESVFAKEAVKVLLVEDNANESNLLAELLNLNGVDVEVVRDGNEAIRSMETRLPDVVLLDMNMPGRDGPSTMKSIRENPRLKDLAIYAVTGSDQKELGIPTNSSEGVDQWFQKPLQPQRLLQALRLAKHECQHSDNLSLLAL